MHILYYTKLFPSKMQIHIHIYIYPSADQFLGVPSPRCPVTGEHLKTKFRNVSEIERF